MILAGNELDGEPTNDNISNDTPMMASMALRHDAAINADTSDVTSDDGDYNR